MSEKNEIYISWPNGDVRIETVMDYHESRWFGHRWFWRPDVKKRGYCTDCSVELHRLEQAATSVRESDVLLEDADHERGLYAKYHVDRLDDPDGKHDECEYFVLDPIHDAHARASLKAYIKASKQEYPQLANDLREMLTRTKWRFQQSRKN